jgi:hypothetical protein
MSQYQDEAVHSKDGGALSKFLNQVDVFVRDLDRIAREIQASDSDEIQPAWLEQLSESMQASIDACWDFEVQHRKDPDAIAEAQRVFRAKTDPFFLQSWFAHRARTKPTGFPGDFEMLCKIYGDTKPGTGIGTYLDRIFMDVPLACGVRGRLEMARRFLIQELDARAAAHAPIRILDIASGPCREYMEWPKSLPPIEVLAMDSDLRAIDYVNSTVAPQMPTGSALSCIQYNAFRTRSPEATIQKFGRFDVIYSVGLCDYLTDDVLVKLLSAWYDTLADDGVLFVAFKDTVRYDQTVYQWHLDWFFYQRTVKDVLELYEKAGFDLGNIETCRDETGIITGFFTRREKGRRLRVDTADTKVLKPTLRLFETRPALSTPSTVQ